MTKHLAKNVTCEECSYKYKVPYLTVGPVSCPACKHIQRAPASG